MWNKIIIFIIAHENWVSYTKTDIFDNINVYLKDTKYIFIEN